MASKTIANQIGDKDYQDIVNTIKKMIEAKRCACTLEQVLKDYRQMRHKKIDYGVYGYTSERDLLDKSNVFKFRIKDGKVFIELKSVKKAKPIKSSSKLSTIKKISYDSSESSDTSRSEILVQSKIYSGAKKFNLPDKSSSIIENYNVKSRSVHKKEELLFDENKDDEISYRIIKSPKRDSSDNAIKESAYNNKTNLKLKRNKETVPTTNNSMSLKSIKNELVSSKINPSQKLTKVQQAMQKMMRSRAGKDIKSQSSKPVSTVVKQCKEQYSKPMSARDAYRHQLWEERQQMKEQINDIQRRKLGGQDVKEQKVLDTPNTAVPQVKEPEKDELAYVPQYSGPRATPLTKLNLTGVSNFNIGISLDKQNAQKELNFLELHVVNILHTKVSAYPDGFIAEQMPDWYQSTFEKSLPTNWMDLVERSKKFFIEKMKDKSLLYAIDIHNLNQIDKESDEFKREGDDKVLNNSDADDIHV